VHPTHLALARIDRSFYREHADDFDRTRAGSWRGWAPVAEWAERRQRAAGRPLSLLDLGCGNGRFGAFLAGRLSRPVEELGVDASVPLLARARVTARREGRRGRWLALDLVCGVGLEAVAGSFDLIVAFGLMHHLPGRDRRTCLLAQAAARLSPGGRLAASFWQPEGDPRLAPRLLDAERHLRALGEPTDGLERGDHLLRWGPLEADDGPLRYCHHTDEVEADALAAAAGLPVVERYRADGRSGRLNLYVILESPRLRGHRGAEHLERAPPVAEVREHLGSAQRP
jgi:tRNA (uracil-5-)-methyltransferase TRM9